MIKNYSNFQVINEEESTEKNSSVKSAEALMGLFFKCYTIAATKIGDYTETISDLIAVTKAEEGEDKGKLLADTITKVAGKMKPEYKDLSGDITKAGEAIKGAYSTMLSSDEGKKSLKSIKTATDKVITDSLEGLKSIVPSK